MLHLVDGLVVFAYGVAMLLVGAWFARRARNVDEYLLGGRGMKPWTVGLSLFASLLSAISYMAHPEEIIQHGPMAICGFAALPFIVFVVGWLLIPRIMKENVATAYELLETRLGPTSRVVGAVLFLSLRFIWMAFIVFLMSTKIITPLLDLDPSDALWISAIVGVVTVVYTSMGGLRAVVVTDVAQTFVLFGGAVLAIVIVHLDRGGFSGWIPSGWIETWDPPRFFYNSENPEARTFFWTGLSVFMWHVCTAGSDQVAIQRYLATRDARAARRAFITSISTDAIASIFLGLLGLALLAYFQAHPELLPGGDVRSTERSLLIQFIVAGLPLGVSGLVIAGLLAAAMSSLSSGINSITSVISNDFVGRFWPRERTEEEKVRLAKACSWVIGLVVVLLSLVVGRIDEDGNLLERANRTVNLLVAPLFVLFFFALFISRATSLAAVTGCVAAIAMAVVVAAGMLPVSVFWLMPLSFATGALVGFLVVFLVGMTTPSTGGRANR